MTAPAFPTPIPALFQPQRRRVMTLAFTLMCAGAALASPATSAQTASHLRAPSGLRCDHLVSPLAIADAHPQLSWNLDASSPTLHGVSQSAYRVQVFATGSSLGPAQNPLWDSGIIHSSATAGIAYAGPALIAQHGYTWRVRVWDEQNHPAPWSALAHWTQAPVWHASWIAASPADADTDHTPLPLFRHSFQLAHPVRRAMLYASGLGQDELRLNGAKVGNDELTPGWSEYRKTVEYDSYDVTARLHTGENALGVLLGNGMYRVLHTPGRYTKFVGSYGPPRCIVQLNIDFADGSSLEIDSDGAWKTHPGPITFSSTYGGEDFDARLEPQGWDRPGFRDAGWQPAAVVNGPGGTLTPAIAPPIRVMHQYKPIRVTHPQPGITIYDFGQNFAGWPAITVAGPAGSSVKLIPGELLDAQGLVTQRSSGQPQWFTYTLRGAPTEHWHPRFSYYGFRYVQVKEPATEAVAKPARILEVVGQAVHTSSEPIGAFDSSDTLFNRIHTLILRAIENNSVSLFTDCPHREKLGWLEETHLMAPPMLYDFDFTGLFAATARNIADTQRTDGPKAGMVPEIAPQYVVFEPSTNEVFNDSPEWGSAAVLAPWYLFERTGDIPFLRGHYDVMRRYVAYLATRANGNIIAYGLGDWYDIGPGAPGFAKLTTMGLTATATYYQDLMVLERTAALLGKPEDSSQYHQQAEQVKAAFNARFYNPTLHRYDKGSQTAQAMPLALDMVPTGERAAVLDALVSDIRAHNNHVTAGDIGYHYVVDALLNAGRSDVLYDMLQRTDTPSYGYQLAQGATSLTEAWDANPHSSQDHFMLGHAEEWFYRGLGGINVDLSRAGASRILLHPAVPHGLQWVRTSYRSALGPIVSNWRRTPAQTAYDFQIPVNATATILLDGASAQTLTVNGSASARAPGVLAAHAEGTTVRLEVSSGSYHILTQ
ncbi:MAG: family 78 glycoside hydrolase catalytic domain [Terracidiphilus sp.]